MSELTYIRIPIQFYALKLNEIQRVILSLAYAFRDKGLKLSDQSMADLFGVTRQWINQLIAKLKADDYIEIDKPGSRYRTIYCQEKLTVEWSQLSGIVDSKNGLLSTLVGSTVNTELTHNIRSKEHEHSFDVFWCSYPKHKDRGRAEKAWAKLEFTDKLSEKIIAAAKDVARRAEGGEFEGPRGKLQFCKHPATWLNAGAWDDEPDEPTCSTRDITEDEADELFKEVL